MCIAHHIMLFVCAFACYIACLFKKNIQRGYKKIKVYRLLFKQVEDFSPALL